MRPGGLLRIVRPVNALVSGGAVALAYLIATGTIVPAVWIPALVVVLVTGAGNTINDYFDREIDRVNRPDRPIPSGGVAPREAVAWAAILFAGGIILSIWTTVYCLIIAVANSCLLVLYAARIKRTAVLGNVSIAYLSASIFLFGGAFAGMDGITRNLPLIGITFLAMLSRELLKDAEDVEGDAAGGARTLPMLIGVRWTAVIAAVCAAGAVTASLAPVGSWWGPVYLAGIAVADAIILAAALRAIPCTAPVCIRQSRVTDILKGGMFVALLAFTGAAVV